MRRIWPVSVAVVLIAASCRTESKVETYVLEARFPAAMTVRADGTLIYGERLTGRVREVTKDGRLRSEPLARVNVTAIGEQGLLGLAVDPNGRVFASYTDQDEGLIVSQVYPGEERRVWKGPSVLEQDVGGHIELDEDNNIVIGIGDLLNQCLINDPTAPNGKILRLDPDGAETQSPEVISLGWNNPFAFDITDDGEIWVADNAVDKLGCGDVQEDGKDRIARADEGKPTEVVELENIVAPAGLHVSGNNLYMCGFVNRELQRFNISSGRARSPKTLQSDCSLEVDQLSDGRIVYSNETNIEVFKP